jgi:O-antigen/teichoic acid export membrane protein
VTNLLILLLSLWLLWQRRGVAELLVVVVISQFAGMVVALAILLTRRLFNAPQVAAPLNLKHMAKGVSPFFGLSLNDVLLQRLDILLLSFFGDARLLGAYSAAYNLVRAAIKLLQSVWRGIYPTLARLYPTSPEQAGKMASRLLYVGFALCVLGALLVSLLAGPVLHLVYGTKGSAEGGAEISVVAVVLSWLVWQAPLYFLELYATTWLMVIMRAGAAFALALLHVLLLTLLLPIGASLAGAVGAAWGTVASQAIAATITLWYLRKSQAQASLVSS